MRQPCVAAKSVPCLSAEFLLKRMHSKHSESLAVWVCVCVCVHSTVCQNDTQPNPILLPYFFCFS